MKPSTLATPSGMDARCTRCHDAEDNPQILEIGKSKHGVRGDARTPTCTSCHGESESHVNKPADATERPKPDRTFTKHSTTPIDVRNDACLSCHKGTARTRWEGSAHHNNQIACADCHQAHAAVDRVLVKKNTINETCHMCHADKRGPFLWEHQPVVENCANCHTPHGSNFTPLLISRSPWLCQSCHDGQHSSENPIGRNAAGNQAGFVGNPATGNAPSNQASGRGCLNCHSVIHGSNSPQGGFFQR